jgi:hypothetical protein
MITLIFFALATIGLTNTIVHGRIFDLIKIGGKSIREWMHHFEWSKQLFECYECTGFWAGLICGYMIVSHHLWLVLPCGFAGSVIAQTFTDLVYLLRSKIEFEVDNETREN